MISRKASIKHYVVISLFIAISIAVASAARPIANWLMGGQDLKNTSFQETETRIGLDTASRLRLKWVTDVGGNISATPAVEGKFLYVPDSNGNFYKIKNKDGAIVWSRKIQAYTGVPGDFARRTPFVTETSLLFGNQAGQQAKGGAQVLAVSKDTGDLLWATVVDGHSTSIITSPVVAYRGVAYVGVASAEENLAAFIPGYPCCDFRGSIVALKVATGEILWKTFTVPDLPGYSGGGVWGGTPTVDVKRRSLYVTSGNNYSRPQSITDCIAGVIATVPPGPGRDQAMRDCDPLYVDNHFDSILALDLDTGAIKWATHTLPEDAWNVACIIPDAPNAACPENAGPDYDFAQAPVLYRAKINGVNRDVLGVGQKSGDFWGLDPDTGSIVWHTVVGPGGVLGGIQWGSATDGKRIYAAISNINNTPWILQGRGPFAGQEVSHGFWSALDGATGTLLWQSPDPNIAMDTGALTVANDVLFAGSMGSTRGAASEDTMFALNSKTGEILWRYPSGGSVNSSPAVVNGVVYWGSGYDLLGLIGTSNYKLYAFSIKGHGKEQSDE